MKHNYFKSNQCEEMARNLWVYLYTQMGVKSAKSMSAGSEADGRKTEGRASNEHPLSIHSASDGERWQNRIWKHVAMIFAVLVMSIANIGMAWADQAYHSVTPNICGTAYEMYGLKQEIYKTNTTVQDAYSSWVTYDIYGSSGTGVSAPSGWLNGSSGKPGYGFINVRAAKPAYLYVTNCTGVAILTKGVSGDTKKPILSVKDASTNTEVDAEVSTTATDWTVLSYGAELDPGKRYIIKLYATTEDNASVSQIRLTAPAVCSAGLSGVTSNPSATTGSSAGTITCGVSNGTAASATSYQWYKTTSNKASASSISGATSSSYSPNEASDGTYYYYCEVTTTQRDLSGATGSCKVETDLSGAFVFTAAPAGSGWGIAGSMNSWTAATNEMTGSGTVSTTISLSANTQYEFKVVDISSNEWYGNGGTIKGGITDWLFETSKGNTYLRTSCAGDYTFTFNTSTKNLSITYPESHKVYFNKDGASWSNIYAYCYNDGDWNIGWPGVEITSNAEDNCGTEYYAYTNGYTYIIFNNGSGDVGNQTGNITVAGYEGKHAVGAAATAWEAYPTYTISYNNGGGSGSMSSQTSIACSTDKATTANTFTRSGYNFTGWHANVDVTVGGATKTAGTLLADGVTIQEIKSDITLTAQWEVDDGCNKIFWFANSADATTNGVTNNTTTFSGVSTGTTAVTGSITIDGKTYTATGRGSNNSTTITFTVPASKVGTLYGLANSSGNSARTLTLTNTDSYRETQSTSASSSTAGAFTFTEMPAGSYSLAWSGNGAENMLCLKLCDAAAVCSATQPGAISKGTLSSCSLPLTASGSPASNNTWYWQASSTGTSTSESGATKNVNSTGTYYIRSYCSENGGCWSEAQTVTVSASDLTPAAPTALASSSPTAKGVTLTVTDAANTNDYEFYVNTSSSAPSAGTSASYTSTSKSITITDKYAGTTFYAWARAKCGSYKSAWTALTGNTFTTSQVTVTHTLTNVTATSGATGANAAGGSDYTAVFAAVSGYSLPAPAITIDGNAAESGTDYTWTQGTGTVVIPANKITGNIVITIASAAAAPTNVAISGAYHYYPGETISLTATATGGNGPKTYQWYHGGTADGNAIDGATSATFTKSNCVVGDAGSYYCKVTCGGSASTWSDGAGHDPYNVKIMQFVLKNNSSVEISRTALTKVDATHATVILHLTGGTTYKFRITDGCGNYFGNTGTMTNGNSTDWYMNADADCGMTTGLKTSNYTFNVTLGDLGNGMQVTAIYPGGDQAAGKIIYWDNSVLNWADGAQWYRIGKSTHHNKIQMTKVSGTANLYKVTTIEYNGFEYWHIADNQGNGDGNLFWTKGDAAKAITNAMEFEGAPVTLDAITVTPTNSHATGETSDNDNCEFYTHTTVSGMKRDRVTITAPVNGTITVNYTSEEDVASSFSATTVDMYQDLAHTVKLTSITAVPNTGYDAGAITINGGAYSANYVVTGATTIAATFTPHTYSITYKDQGDAAFSGSHVDSPNAHPTTHTYATATTLNSATKTGYTFGGWFTNSACTGEAVASLGATAFSADITLYAKWTVNNYDLTWNLGGGTTTSAGTGIASGVSSNTTTSQAFGTALTAPTVTKTGYNFSAWSPTVAGTMPAANTTYTATWTVKTTTITIDANSGNHGSTTPGNVTATYGSALPSFTAATGASGWNLTGYFTAPTSGTKVINANGTLVANTDYADGSGNWKYETATLTLFPQYEEEVSCTGDPTALVSGTLYQVSDMASACLGEITGTGQYFYGLSSNGKFYINGTTNSNNASTGTVEIKTASNTIDKIAFTGIAWFKDAGTNTCRSIKFVVPSAGTLTIYGKTSSGKGNVVIKTESSDNTTVIANSVNAYASGSTTVSAGTYYVLSDGGSAAIVGLKFVESACSTPAAPTISGTAAYTAGQTITLTANCASGADASTTYAWYKGADWATARAASPVQAAATGSAGYTFTKASCVVGDAGTYWCEASNGSGCEAHNATGKAITVSAASLTAIEANTLYGGADIASITLTESDQNFTGLSANTKFQTHGAVGSAAFGKTVSTKSVTDDIDTKNFTAEIYVRAANNTSSTSDPTEGAIEFFTPATDGTLYIYLGNTGSNLTLKKHGVNENVSLSGANYKKIDVTANTHYFIQGASSNRTLYGIKFLPSVPEVTAFGPASGSTIKTGTTVTITGTTGSTIYYMWGTSTPPANAAAVVSGGTAGTSGAATVTTTGISSSNTYLYAVAVKNEVNSTLATASYTIDDTAPTFVSSVPANGATDQTVSGTIVLTFSEALGSVDATKFTLTGATKGAVAIDGSDATKVNIAYSGAANEATVTLATAAAAVSDAAGNSSAALSSISFTTEAADACPAAASGEVVYKFVTKSSGLGTSAICAAANTDYPLTTGSGNPLETLTNGSLTARASSAGTTQLKYNTSSINFNGGSNGWLIIGLDCPIKSGDVIRYVNSNSGSVAIRTAKGTSTNEIVLAGNSTTKVQTVVITSAQATAFNESTTVYMVRKSGTSDISYFEIIRPYVITLDANTNGGKVNGENTEVHYMLSGESLVLPHATKSGYRFKGWFTTSGGATQASTNYSPTGTTTLYAQFEDCPGSGTVYKWEVKSGLENGSLPVGVSGEAEMDADEGNYLSTLIGGTLTLHNKNNHIKISDNSKFSIDDNAPYIIVNLDCALEAGDKFVATVGSHTAYVTKTSSRASTVELPTGTKQETAVPAELEGASTLYIWRGSGNYNISYFEITRTSTTYTVSYDANGGTGTAPTDGTAYARNAEVTVKGNTGSLTKSNYDALAYWNTEDDGTGTDYAISTGTFEITADVTLYAKWTQAVTLDANTANHGSAGGSATAVWNATGLTGITHATPASGYKLLGYYTTASGDGVKVVNSDGTFAGTTVDGYITSGKWSRTGAAPTLYARYESSGSLIWNLGVNTDATSLTTSSKNSEFAQIAGSNMTNAALTGISYSQSKKSELTGVIETPTSYDGAKYVSVTFQVAAGYKFTPSSVNVKVQPKDNAKTVKLELSDASSHSQNYTSGSQSAGSIHTVTMTGNGTFYTGTVTLKIYCYGASGGYRLGTPISIEGEVEATCTMPSFDGLNYEQTSYSLEDDASAITVTNPANVTTYAWKQNTTNDRSGTTPASGTNNTTSYTPPTSAAGTLYYWCELTNDCGTVKTPAVGITVSATKSDAPIIWTGTSASANYGGGGYTVKATVNDTEWNGNAADLTLSAPAGIRIYNIVSGTADSKKYVQASFDVTTAFDRETYSSTIPFVVTADATATYNAISDEHAVGFDACTGGGGSSEEYMPVDAAHIDNATWKGGWVYSGTGMMRYSHGGSDVSSSKVKSLAHNMGAGNVITKYYKSSANHFGFYTEKAINGVRLYVYTSNDKSTVSGVYIANSAYTSGTPSTGAVAYEATYYNDDDGLLGTTNDGCTWVEIMFDSEVAAGKYGQINLSKNVNIAGIAFISSSGSGAKLSPTLSFATAGPITKQQSSANFTNALTIGVYPETLGAITYTSSNTSCATVNATTGEVTITASGSADLSTTITATLAASGCYRGATASYVINVAGVTCEVNHGTLSSNVTSKCETEYATLTLTDFEPDASVQWYNGETPISDGSTYAITTEGTTSTMVTKEEGTYSVMVTKDACSDRSNSITISNKSTSVPVTRLVKEWYIKNGRLTPDIALWELGDDCSFVSVTASSGWDANTGLTAASSFYEKDGVVYLKGTEPNANAEAVQDYTLTLTVNDGCDNQTLDAEGKKITIHHQQNTDKHVLAFVVRGTDKGDWTAGVTADQTTNVGLYNAIADNFDVLATNSRSTDDEQKLKEYYSQFDILCITDYPDTKKDNGVNGKSTVDALGALVDIRPILTMEAWVSGLANWMAKGISGSPKSPTTRQYTMDLQCKDHEIFAGTKLTKVGEGDEAMYRVSMVDNTKEDYVSLDATYGGGAHAEKDGYNYGGKPALQGFTFTQEMSDNDLLPIGLIDDGAGNPLQVGIERQHNMEARLMVLGINSYAMERLTDDGERVVINALNYLMKKNAEDIADCSTSFVGGAEGDTKNWNNKDNWTGNTVPLPSQKVRILADCEVSSTVYAQSVLIVTGGKYNHGSDDAAGKLTIKENGALIVGGKIQAASAPAYNRPRATTPDTLLIETSSTNQAALIFDNEEAETQATVNLYSLGRKDGNYQYQYFAVPMEVVPVNPTFANETHGGTGIYTYVYSEASSGWTRRKYYDDLFAFEGLGITTKSTGAMEYSMTGNLASTATKEITLTHDGTGLNLIGNSWMAPIQIGALAEDNTDANITKTVYIYCAGRDAVDGAATSGVTETAGQWIAIPFEAAEFATWRDAGKLSVIPAMQAFQIKVSAEATLTLDYKKVVRGSTNDLNAKLRAPGRRMAANEVTMTNIRVADSKTHTDLSLFEGDRFSEAFDNGWEAEYMNGDGRSAKLYAETEAGQMAVAAMYDYEGTVVGFAPGQETEYTFSFMGEDNGYYLNDIKLQNSVRISEGETYTFTYEEGDAANRFYISRTAINAPEVTTGMENLDAAAPRVQKIIYNDKLYIIRGGRLYDATGKVVK